MSDDSRDALLEQTDILLSNLIAHTGEILVGLSETPQCDKLAVVSNKGRELLDTLELSQFLLGKFDLRNLDGRHLILILNEHLAASSKYDSEFNEDKLKKIIEAAADDSKKIEKNLDKEWNSKLDPATSIDIFRVLRDQKSPKKKSTKSESGPFFHKFSPQLETTKYDCTVQSCGSILGNFKSYKRHLKDKHKNVPVEVKLEIRGHCFLPKKNNKSEKCMLEVSDDQINSHLRTHGVTVPEGRKLRGFIKKAGSDYWECLFLNKNEKDPDYPDEEDMPKGTVAAQELACKRNLQGSFDDVSDSLAESGKDQGSKNVDSSHFDDGGNMELESATDQGPKNSDFSSNIADSSATNPTNNVEDLNDKADLGNLSPEKSKNSYLEVAEDVEVLHTAVLSPEKSKTAKHMFDDIEDEIVSGDINDEDSDCEATDSLEFTKRRMKNKKERHDLRSKSETDPFVEPHLMIENQEVILKFKEYLDGRYINTQENNSTVRLSMLYLFEADDSWLKYLLKKDPQFSLKKHLAFGCDSFCEVESPIPWQHSIAGDSKKEKAIRRKEFLKAHARYRRFIVGELNMNGGAFGQTLEGLTRRSRVEQNLENISKIIEDMKTFKQLDIIINNDKKASDLAKAILNPSKNHNEKESVKVWFQSQKWEEIRDKNLKVYEEAKKKGQIKPEEFREFASLSRFLMNLMDKQRATPYDFNNQTYFLRLPTYLTGDEADQINNDGIDVYKEKEEDSEPTGFVLKVSGNQAGVKGNKEINIIVTGIAMQFLEMFRELKEIVFGSDMDLNQPFFCSYTGAALAANANTRGSFWSIFSEITETVKATSNCVRRGAEQAVQKSPEKAKRSRELLGHSVDTGANIYNKNDDATRAKFITGCAKREGSDATANQESSKKLKLDKELRTKIAKETLSKRNDRKLKLGPKCTLLPEDKKVIQEVFSKENYRSITKLNPAKKFPGEKAWKKAFYRLVDGMESSEDHDKLKEIEKKTFDHVVKSSLLDKGEETWRADLNSRADVLISKKIRTALRSSEYNKNDFEPSFFKF